MADFLDRDMLIRVDEQVKRMASDARSEKDSRARASKAIHDEITQLRSHMDREIGKLSERIDAECGKLSQQISQGGEKQGSQIKWLERCAWMLIGAASMTGLAKLAGIALT